MSDDLGFIIDEPGSIEDILNRIVVMALPGASDAEHMHAVEGVLNTRRQEVEEAVLGLREVFAKKTDDAFEKFCRYTQALAVVSTIASMLHGRPQCLVSGCPRPAQPCPHGFCYGCHELGSTCGDNGQYDNSSQYGWSFGGG